MLNLEEFSTHHAVIPCTFNMEKEIIPVEENAVPKSTGSIVQISSIYVEIPIPKENNETADICLHNFSIR